jgi:hypothetical protein
VARCGLGEQPDSDPQTLDQGNFSEPKSKKSKAPLAMAPLLAKYLRAWQKETAYAKATDWVFASNKTHGRTPRVGNMLCVDYLRPAAIKARVELEKGQRSGSITCATAWHRSSSPRRRPTSNGPAQHAACKEHDHAGLLRPDGHG